MSALVGTPHFTLAEVQRNTQWPIPEEYHANAQRTLEFLEEVRAVVGVPLILTSLWRSPEYNASLPGHATASQHLTADGADVKPQGITLAEASARFLQGVRDGRVSAFRQFIAEENGKDGLGAHIHVGTGVGGQTLARDAEGVYHQLTDWLNAAVAAVDDALQTVFDAGNGAVGMGAAGVALIGGFRRMVALFSSPASLTGTVRYVG